MSKRDVINFIKEEKYVKKGELENASPSELKRELENIMKEREREVNKDELLDDEVYETAQEYLEIVDGIKHRQKIYQDRSVKRIGAKTNLPHDMENVIGDYLGSSKYNTTSKTSKRGGKKTKRKRDRKGKKHNKKSRKSRKSRKARR